MPWFRQEGLNAVFSDNWNPTENHFGALSLIYGTFLVGFLALLLAVPISIGIALFVTEIAPKQAGQAGDLHRRPARGDPVGGLRALGDLRAASTRSRTSSATSRRRPSDIPILKTLFAEPERDGPQLPDGRDRRRDHDHADHHVDHARSVRDHADRR